MDLQTLRFFCTAATEGSLTKAAQRLNYAQSNLSTRMHALEEELGVQLFQRGAGGSRLTPKGEVLFSYAQRILNLADETASAVQDEGTPQGTVILGTMESAAFSFLPGLLRMYHQKCPKVRTMIRTMPSRQAIQGVLDCQLDAAIVGGEVRHQAIASVPLTQEKLVLLSEEKAPLQDLLSQPLVVFEQGCSYRQRLEQLQARYGVPSQGIMEMNSLGAILASVTAGLGVSLFPESMLASLHESRYLARTELPGDLAAIPVCLVYRRDGYIPTALREMTSVFREDIKDI
ncbi:MAG: LysR family transcriptional regulator [Clostridia bacterium]|nr:LysR family transcriptional regulator [Clostridia bacterium]